MRYRPGTPQIAVVASQELSLGPSHESIIDTMRHLVGADSSYMWLLSDGEVQVLDKEAGADLATLRATMDANGSGLGTRARA